MTNPSDDAHNQLLARCALDHLAHEQAEMIQRLDAAKARLDGCYVVRTIIDENCTRGVLAYTLADAMKHAAIVRKAGYECIVEPYGDLTT